MAVAIAVGIALAGASPAFASPPSYSGATGVTGQRPSATSLSFRVSDQTQASVDVATGNLLVSTSSLALVGVNAPVRVSEAYNSLGTSSGSGPSATNWTLGLDGAGFLAQGPSLSIVYTDATGATWPFTPVSGSTSYTSPAGFKADLVSTSSSGWTLTDKSSQRVITFNASGQPTSIADRNGNTTTVAYAGGDPSSVVSSAGPVAARTASLSYDSGTRTRTVAQSSGSLSRSIKYVKDASSNLVKIVDALGKETAFAYSGSQLTQITAPTGQVTTIAYTGSGKVESVSQANTTSGSPGTSVTRFAYPTTTETLVARPNTNQSSAVSAVPHLTYDFDATTKLVGSATDELGRARSATYTPQSDVATSTSGSGTGSGTTTNEWNANSGDSQTKSTSPGGAAVSASYGNTADATKYLATSSTDSAGNQSTYTYNGAGNQLTSSSATAATATLTYNSDGTVDTALAPGNDDVTNYDYNGNHQLTSITPVAGSSLGARVFTYDALGRTKTATDGRGVTVTYTYDLQDRVLSTAFSDSTPTVTNTYDDGGQIKTRVDGNGTTTYGYDQLGRLISRVNTFAGGTISYGYDKASDLTTVADSRGTTTYSFDDSGIPTKVSYGSGSSAGVLAFATDSQGRRTDSWMDTNTAHTVWSAHTHQDYDTSGRVTRVIAESSDGTNTATVTDVSYCYNTGSVAPTCATGTSGDRSKLQWQRDNLSGQVTAYTYDQAGRLTQAAQSGGAGANTWAYTYDDRGNRLTSTVTGATPSTQEFTANEGNQINSGGYDYDGAGNLVTDPSGSYAYTGSEQMKTVTKAGTTYTYKYAGTAQDEVIQQQSADGTTKLVYGRTDAQGLPVIEQSQLGTATAYVDNDPVTGQPLMLRSSTGARSLYVYNGTGSPVALLGDCSGTASTYKYDPYGVATYAPCTLATQSIRVDTQVSKNTTDSPNTVTTPSFSTSASNELIVALVQSDGPVGQTQTVSGAGLTWSLAARSNAQEGTSEIWTAVAAEPLSDATVDVTHSNAEGSSDQSITVIAYLGASGVGATAVAASGSGAPTVSLTSTAAGSLVIGDGNDFDGPNPRTVGSDQAMVHEHADTVHGADLWVQKRTALTTGAGQSVTLNDTAPTADRWNFAAAEIVPSAPTPLAPVAPATIATDVQVSQDQRDASGTEMTPSFSTTGSGELILALVQSDGPVGQTVTISGGGLSWSLVKRSNGREGSSEVWKAIASGPLTNQTVTATQSHPGDADMSLTVIGYLGASGVGASAAANAASGAPSVSLTSTAAGSVVIGGGNDYDGPALRELGADQSMIHEDSNTTHAADFWVQKRTTPTTGPGQTVALNDTAPTSDRWNMVAVEVVPASGAGVGGLQSPFGFADGSYDRGTGWQHYGARWYDPTTGRWTQQDALDIPLDPANANRYAYAADDPLNVLDRTGLTCRSAIFGILGTGLLVIVAAAAEIPSVGLDTVATAATLILFAAAVDNASGECGVS